MKANPSSLASTVEHITGRRLQAHVRQHHGLHRGVALELQAEGAAHTAVGPIRSDHKARHGVHGFICARGADEDAVVGPDGRSRRGRPPRTGRPRHELGT